MAGTIKQGAVKPMGGGGGSEASITYLKLRNVACVGDPTSSARSSVIEEKITTMKFKQNYASTPKAEESSPEAVDLQVKENSTSVSRGSKASGSSDKVFGAKYKYCKTEIREIELTEVITKEGTPYPEEHTLSGQKLQTYLKQATMEFKAGGKGGQVVEFKMLGKKKWWTAVWENPDGSAAFPCSVEVSLVIEGFDQMGKSAPVYAMNPVEAKLRDPEKAPGCCVIS